jgi:2-haloacid dehalogenase
MKPASPRRRVAIFDLGGVLIDWNPRYLYRKLFAGDVAAMERFLAEICTDEWNRQQDAGRTFADATQALLPAHALYREHIEAWRTRFDEMIGGAIDGTVDVLAALKGSHTPLYAITNWSAETFAPQRARFAFLDWFDDIVVSGLVGITKPDPRIFRVLLDRNRIAPEEAVFIDDVETNVSAATALGMLGIRFSSPAQLRRDLAACGLLAGRA